MSAPALTRRYERLTAYSDRVLDYPFQAVDAIVTIAADR